MTQIPFIKMHGAGNDFVVIDNRAGEYLITAQWAEKLADRRLGIGCDQLIVMEKEKDKLADVLMRIYNADGSEIDACGNASRCIAWWIMEEAGREEVVVQTGAGLLKCARSEEYDDHVTVDMGMPKTQWDQIPLSEQRNTLHLGIDEGLLMDPVAVNMGNPHMVFFVKDLQHMRMEQWGPKLEVHSLYPERCNVSVVQVKDREHLQLVVWERGSGLTLACGTAACAALVAGVQRDLCERRAHVELPGGELFISWDKERNHVMMTGPVAHVFDGTFDQEILV